MIAIGLFFFILLLIFSTWDLQNHRTKTISQRSDMEAKASIAMNTLLLTPGSPNNWYETDNYSSVGLIGLGDYDLDVQKVQGLVSKNSTYENTSLALGVAGYNLLVDFINSSGVVYTFGSRPGDDARQVVVRERLSNLENEPITVRLEVWSNE